jgi:glycosyltransferase involved in cell wall biosynthesis
VKATPYTSERCKLAVLDANFYWTEQLFSAYREYADILLLRPWDFRAFRRKYGCYFIDWQPQPVGDGVWEQRICCPPGWLFHYWPLTRRFLAYLIRRFQGDSRLIFAFNYPYYYSLARLLTAFSIYYNIDDYRHYWPGREAKTEQVERQAVTQANLTVCVAQYRANHLRQQCPGGADRIIHLPHGCSPDFMVDEPLAQPRPLPTELQAYKRPLAGYIGALNYRFDYDFLAVVARQLPEVTFILGGRPPQPADGSSAWWAGVEAARSLSNIRWIGRVPHQRLGEYLQSFNVLLMPYAHCDFNTNACPMKLWDYMGTSLPIVANEAVPEVTLWRHLVRIAETPDEFAAHIRLAVANPGWQAKERLDIASTHTWRHQARKLNGILQEDRLEAFQLRKLSDII